MKSSVAFFTSGGLNFIIVPSSSGPKAALISSSENERCNWGSTACRKASTHSGTVSAKVPSISKITALNFSIGSYVNKNVVTAIAKKQPKGGCLTDNTPACRQTGMSTDQVRCQLQVTSVKVKSGVYRDFRRNYLGRDSKEIRYNLGIC